MEKASENSSYINEKAASYLGMQRRVIMEYLLLLRERDPKNRIIQEIEKIGGMGMISMTLELIENTLEQKDREVAPKNAEFVVAMLHSFIIRNFLVSHSRGQLHSHDLEDLRNFFLEQI